MWQGVLFLSLVIRRLRTSGCMSFIVGESAVGKLSWSGGEVMVGQDERGWRDGRVVPEEVPEEQHSHGISDW